MHHIPLQWSKTIQQRRTTRQVSSSTGGQEEEIVYRRCRKASSRFRAVRIPQSKQVQIGTQPEYLDGHVMSAGRRARALGSSLQIRNPLMSVIPGSPAFFLFAFAPGVRLARLLQVCAARWGRGQARAARGRVCQSLHHAPTTSSRRVRASAHNLLSAPRGETLLFY